MDAQALDKVRQLASNAILPLKPAVLSEAIAQDLLFRGKRTNAGRELPQYDLVYFMLADLLKFPDLGRWEKTAWSIPVGSCTRYHRGVYRSSLGWSTGPRQKLSSGKWTPLNSLTLLAAVGPED
jgi:hypothetical protein